MNSDLQILFNLAATIAGAGGGWVIKMIYDRMNDLQAADKSLAATVDDIKTNYARRDDFREAINDVKRTLLRIESKLDSKADKQQTH